MIKFVTGNIFDSNAEALVNPVNCVGAMGAGLAKEFAKRYAGYYDHYKKMCLMDRVTIGGIFAYDVPEDVWNGHPYWILSFPTKRHWKDKSRIEDIEAGLKALEMVLRGTIVSVAIPALGCGLGGLDWKDVKPLIERILGGLDEVEITVYEAKL